MKTIQVFDPALCCSTGVCGVEVDQALVGFSADVDWAQAQGATIQRFNLAQEPMAFADHAAVKSALERQGADALPLTLLDGQVVLSGRYPSREELARWLELGEGAAAPGTTAPHRDSARNRLAAIAVGAAPAAGCCSPAPATATGAASTAQGGPKCC